MANKIDSHFNDFGGLDSRTNKMFQNSKTARDGQNFEFRTDGADSDFDVLAKRRGFQHKSSDTAGAEVGLIEYKYKDINTGASKTEILGVGEDGKLRKRIRHRLKIVRSGGTAAYYSLFYNGTTWTIEFLNSSYVSVGSTTFNATVTLDTLKTTLSGLAITGLTFTTVDDDGSSVTSSYYAYLLDVCYRVPIADSSTVYNELFSFSTVVTPNSTGVLFDYVAGSAWKSNKEFAGISYENLNNAVYITDGGFPIKYDGKAAYRAGMPKVLTHNWLSYLATSPSGFALTAVNTSGGSLDAVAVYKYRFQLGFIDRNGIEILGKLSDPMGLTTGAANPGVSIAIPPIKGTSAFPVFACRANGNQDINSGALTFNVDSGHNIVAGMFLRIPINNAAAGFAGYSFVLCKVASVTSGTITLSSYPASVGTQPSGYPASATHTIMDDQWINGGYCDETYQDKATDITLLGSSYIIPSVILGAFVRIYRTQGGGSEYYRLIDVPLQYDNGVAAPNNKYTFTDVYADSGSGNNLSTEPLDDSEGEDLPRACRYLSSWQGQLVQAGRPYDLTIADAYYPTNYLQAALTNSWSTVSTGLTNSFYTEVHMCDQSSVYWADPLNPEGFPQSGLNEESFDGVFDDSVSGLGGNKESFFVFKERSMGLLSGTLATGDITKEILEVDVGCASHNSIRQVSGGLMFLDKNLGFCHVIAGRLPQVLGYPIQDKNKKNQFLVPSSQYRWAGARAANHLINDKYICFIPVGTNDKENSTAYTYPSSDSVMFVFDYSAKRNCWYKWNGLNAAGGVLSSNDELLISDWVSTNKHLWSQKKTGSIYDFSDDTSAVSFIYRGSWLNYGLLDIDKKWVQVAISSVKRGFDLLVSQYYSYNDTKEAEVSITFTSGLTVSPKKTVSLNKIKALSFSLGFENSTIHQDTSINGWDIQYSAEYDGGEVKS